MCTPARKNPISCGNKCYEENKAGEGLSERKGVEVPSNTVLPDRGEVLSRAENRKANRFSGKAEVEDVRCVAGTRQRFPGCLRSVHRPLVVVCLITGHVLHTVENPGIGSQSVRHRQAPLVWDGLSRRHWGPAPGPHSPGPALPSRKNA